MYNPPNYADIHAIVTKAEAEKAQQVLFDNGIEADETATVLQELGFVLFRRDLSSLIDWNFEPELTEKETR